MFNRGLLGLLILLLAACASIPKNSPLTEQQIDAWVAEQNYGHALAALENIPVDNPQFSQLLAKRSQVQDLARDYAAAVLALVGDLVEDQELGAALSELRLALENYPQSKPLAEEQKQLQTQSQLAQRELNDQLLVIKVQRLFEELSLQRRLARLDPDYPVSRITDLRSQLDYTTGELLECGQHAMHDGKLERAELCLTLAKRIQDTQLTRTALASLEQQQTQRKKASRSRILHSQDKNRRQQTEQLLAQSNEALARDDLLEARQALTALLAIAPDNADALTLNTAVNAALAARLDELLRQGNQLYRSGNIEQAKRTWEEGLQIDPNHAQLRTNVQRAERVLQNLEELSRKEAVRQ